MNNIALCIYRNSKIYWSHTDLDYDVPAKIYSANFDGTQEEVLVDTDILYISKCTNRVVGTIASTVPHNTKRMGSLCTLSYQVTLLWTGLVGICTGWTVLGPE